VKNAALFAEIGAARVLDEEGLSPDRLRDEILSLLKDEKKLACMKEALAVFAKTTAASDIAARLLAYRKEVS